MAVTEEIAKAQRHLRRLAVLASAVIVSACDGPQSALVPAGRDAEQIGHLFTVIALGALLVWAAVVAIAVYAIRVRKAHTKAQPS